MNIPYKNILVYIDGSEASMSAMMYCILEAKRTNSNLSAIYVVNTRALNELVKSHIFMKSESSSYETDMEEDAVRYLNHSEKLAKIKGIELKTHFDKGSVISIVQEYIKENDHDLLVLPANMKIRSRRDEVASEVDRLARSVNIPVLLIKDSQEIWDSFEKEEDNAAL